MVTYTKKGQYRVSNDYAIVIKGESSDSLFIRANYTIPASSLKTLIDDGYLKSVRSNVKSMKTRSSKR